MGSKVCILFFSSEESVDLMEINVGISCVMILISTLKLA